MDNIIDQNIWILKSQISVPGLRGACQRPDIYLKQKCSSNNLIRKLQTQPYHAKNQRIIITVLFT